MCHFFVFFIFFLGGGTKWWSYSWEGLLSKGSTRSSFDSKTCCVGRAIFFMLVGCTLMLEKESYLHDKVALLEQGSGTTGMKRSNMLSNDMGHPIYLYSVCFFLLFLFLIFFWLFNNAQLTQSVSSIVICPCI